MWGRTPRPPASKASLGVPDALALNCRSHIFWSFRDGGSLPGAKPKAIRRREPSLESQAAAVDDPSLLTIPLSFRPSRSERDGAERNLLIRRSFLDPQAEWS